MEPKFQSSFIPKNPITSGVASAQMGRKKEERSLLSFLSFVVFTISVILAVGMFGYKFYLKYSINKMSTDLESARVAIQPEIIEELTSLDNRLVSVEDLLSKRRSLTPLFQFLEESTPRTVRFTEFNFVKNDKGLELSLKGEARGYGALALQADILNKNEYFSDSIFSNLNLNQRGDVNFSLTTKVNPTLVSYQRSLEGITVSSEILPTVSTTTVATTTQDIN